MNRAMRCACAILGGWLLLALPCSYLSAAAPSSVAALHASAETVLHRLLAMPAALHPALPYHSWPPRLIITPTNKLQAFSEAPGCDPRITLSAGLLERVVGDSQARMAFVLGHELSHILLGHTRCSGAGVGGLQGLAFVQAQEYAADQAGLQLTLAAGYNYQRAFSLFRRLQAVAGNAPIEALAAHHPSISERAARLQRIGSQQALWESMGAFQDGVAMLASRQYALAAEAFTTVTRAFPKAYEAWSDLGYAYLMRYGDKLRAADLAQLRLGEVATGGYYREAGSLAAQLRGVNVADWNHAAAALQYAQALAPKSAVILGDLGLAYAMAPEDAMTARAPALLRQAEAAAGTGEDRARDAINLAVALERLGQPAAARAAVGAAEQACAQGACPGLRAPLLYQRWLLARKPQAQLDALTRYLSVESHSSGWWQLAYAAYPGLCRELHQTPQPAAAFPQPLAYRRVEAVTVSGRQVAIGENLRQAAQALGPATVVAAGPATPLERMLYPALGVDLVGGESVAAIVLYGPHAPALELQPAALTAKGGLKLAVGGSQNPILPLLGPDPDEVTLGGTDGGGGYAVLGGTGVAAQIGPDGHLRQLMVMALPDDGAE